MQLYIGVFKFRSTWLPNEAEVVRRRKRKNRKGRGTPFADEGDSGSLVVRATMTKSGEVKVGPFAIIHFVDTRSREALAFPLNKLFAKKFGGRADTDGYQAASQDRADSVV